MKVVINRCFGGFGLSDEAYEKLIEWGIPVRKYIEQEQDEETGLFKPQPLNDGEVIFDRELSLDGPFNSPNYRKLLGRYWETWIDGNRTHPLLIQVVEELGVDEASGPHASLAIVEIPEGTDYSIEEYDGSEHVAEVHRTWR